MKTLKQLRGKQQGVTDMSAKSIAAAVNEANEMAKREATERWRNEEFQRYNLLIARDNVYYVTDQSKYLIYNLTKGWLYVDQVALKKKYQLTGTDENRWFDEALDLDGRIRDSVVITFKETDKSILNLLSYDQWLKPKQGPVHKIFGVLLDSLGGGRPAVREHIERCFAYKYCYPENYKLPCITISGEGGVGRNEFIELVLGTVFGTRQVAVLGTKSAFGEYNGSMIGKTVVFIDEAIPAKVNADDLKRKAGNPTIDINVKYGVQGNFDNTPWYWLGGNGTNGSMFLAGDTTDRRYSVITVNRNLMHWVGKLPEINMEVDGRKALPDNHPCVAWWNENVKALSDSEEVSHWLYEMLQKYGDQPRCPSAWHDEDYTNVLESQKGAFQETMEHVFDDPKFEHIEKDTLYQIYEIYARKNNSQPKQAQNFHADCKDWLRKAGKAISINVRVKIKRKLDKPTSGPVYNSGKTICVRNDDDYIRFNTDYKKWELVERVCSDIEPNKVELAWKQFDGEGEVVEM
jgi:hypothetical protein